MDALLPAELFERPREDVRRARLLILLVMLFGPLCVLVALYRLSAGMGLGLVLPPAVIAVMVMPMGLLVRVGRIEAAANLVVTCWFGAATTVMFMTPVPPPGALFGAMIFPLIAVMLSGSSRGIRWGIALTGVAIGASVRWLGVEYSFDTMTGNMFQVVRAGIIALAVLIAVSYEVMKDAMRDDLVAERARADEANAAKTRMLGNVSHEIRNPMNGVLGAAELLLGTELDDRQRELSRAILHSGKNLLSLLDDLLDFARLEENRLTIREAPFEPAPVVRRVAQLFRPQAAAKGLRLDLEIEGPEVRVLGDPGRFQQVVSNLVGNAVKYTERGRVGIQLHIAEGPEFASIRLEVEDTGRGISDSKKIFERFEREREVEHSTVGLGLGLSITQEIISRMKGTIDVTSAVGVGSTFRVELELPLAAASDQDLATVGFDGVKVLVAEDHPVNRMVVEGILRSLGCVPTMVESGEEALDALAGDHGFDIAFMDVRMPGIDGLEATRRIREAGNDLPIVAVTGNATPEEAEACRTSGMNDFLPKPIDRASVSGVLERWLR